MGDSVGFLADSLCEILPLWTALLVGAIQNFIVYGLIWLIFIFFRNFKYRKWSFLVESWNKFHKWFNGLCCCQLIAHLIFNSIAQFFQLILSKIRLNLEIFKILQMNTFCKDRCLKLPFQSFYRLIREWTLGPSLSNHTIEPN